MPLCPDTVWKIVERVSIATEVVLWQLDRRRAEKLNLAFVADLVDLMVNHKCYVVCMSRAHMSASVSKGS